MGISLKIVLIERDKFTLNLFNITFLSQEVCIIRSLIKMPSSKLYLKSHLILLIPYIKFAAM